MCAGGTELCIQISWKKNPKDIEYILYRSKEVKILSIHKDHIVNLIYLYIKSGIWLSISFLIFKFLVFNQR